MPELSTIADIHVDADGAAAELCRRSFYFFVQEFWDVIIPEEPVWNWHIEYLCDIAQSVVMNLRKTHDHPVRGKKLADIIINIPPGSTKSTVLSVMMPAWAWVIDPTLRILSTSFSDEVAMAMAVKSRTIIQSDRYRKYFPEIAIKKDQNNKTNYENTRNGQRYASGIGGSITSMHFHLILIDDPLNPKQAASEVECRTASSDIDNTLSTRKVDKEVTVTMMIMQRLSENDPTGHMLSKEGKKIRHICLPAEVMDNPIPAELAEMYVDGLLDPVRISHTVIAEAKIDLGAAGYAGQFAQRPAPAGGLIWQKWFKVVPDAVFPDKRYMTQFGHDWDTAYTEDDSNAASAYVAAGKIKNKIYIDDIDWKWLEFPDLINWMKTMQGIHYIEAKASGKSIKQTLTAAGIIAIEVKVTGGSDKVARARMATPIAEAGMVYIRQSLVERLYSDSKQGILNFPRGKFKDLADALAQSLQRLGKKSSLSSHSTAGYDE
jgi:predicted phage terminase large subunit-like protein